MEVEDSHENHPQAEEKLGGTEDDYDVIQEPCHNPERPENPYVSSPLEKPRCSLEAPPLPDSRPASMMSTKKTTCLTQKNLNIILIAVATVQFIVLFAVLLYIGLSTTAKLGQLDASNQRIDERVHGLSVETEANFARLGNLWVLLGRENSMANISLLDFAILVESLQENLNEAFNRIERIDSSLRDHISATNTSLTMFQQQFEELGSNVALLENATGNIDSRQRNFAEITATNLTTLGYSLANVSSDLSQLELDTSRNLNLVESSLHQDIQRLASATEDSNVQLRQYIDTKIRQVNDRLDTIRTSGAISLQSSALLTIAIATVTSL